MADDRYLTFLGRGPRRVVHWEHWSNPDAATAITGIDYYDAPRSCLAALNERYPFLGLPLPATDDPLPRISEQSGRDRWGHQLREHWQQDRAKTRFPDRDAMLAFSPLEQGDFSGWGVVVDGDYSSEEVIFERFRRGYPTEWGDQAPAGSAASVGFYNTLFMWPLLVFGYQNFLSLCLDPEFERIMAEFTELNRRVFRAFARLPIHFVICHDDIVTTAGPICSPAWMHRFIFPAYEEFWSLLRAAGKHVIFMADGCLDAFADDVMACGARGVISEPMTNYKALARRYDQPFLAGEGDCRVLLRNDPTEIRAMFEAMLETARMSAGTMFCIGNHIPFNTPWQAIQLYFDLSAEHGFR